MAIYSEFSHEKWWFSMVMLVYQRVSTKKMLVIVPGILQKVESPLPVSTSAPGRAYWDWGMHRINSYVFSGNVGQHGI